MVQIIARRKDSTTIFDISGSIDLAHSSELRRVVLLEIREKRTPRVILNLVEVKYIDSSGVEGFAGRWVALHFVRFEPGRVRSAKDIETADDL